MLAALAIHEAFTGLATILHELPGHHDQRWLCVCLGGALLARGARRTYLRFFTSVQPTRESQAQLDGILRLQCGSKSRALTRDQPRQTCTRLQGSRVPHKSNDNFLVVSQRSFYLAFIILHLAPLIFAISEITSSPSFSQIYKRRNLRLNWLF